MRVLVCGGRKFSSYQAVRVCLGGLVPQPTHIIEGGATGADELANAWASKNKIPVTTYDALWHKHGPAAGPIRNQQMIEKGKPDLVVAFPGGTGTADMVRRAKAAGVRVIEVR